MHPHDCGNAPNAVPGTKSGTATTPPDYQTTARDGASSHVITKGRPVYLGLVPPDSDDGTLQNSTATGDNLTGTNDEDGIVRKNLPTILTNMTSVKMNVTAANGTTNLALLACWIDFDRNGQFGDTASEIASAVVPPGTLPGTVFPPTFSGFPTPLTAGPTALRCRISTDVTRKATVAPIGVAGLIGPASDGEVEDYMVNGIYDPCNTSPITSLPTTSILNSGVQFTVSRSSGMIDIASIQCPKPINVDPATGITFSPTGMLVPSSSPTKWTFTPGAPSVTVSARKASTASATIMCTVSDALGQTCATDPWFASVLRLKGSGVARDSQLITASKSDDHTTVINGKPGVEKVEITVIGQKFDVNGLRDGEVRGLWVTSAKRDGDNNAIYVAGKRKPGGSADLIGEPGRCN